MADAPKPPAEGWGWAGDPDVQEALGKSWMDAAEAAGVHPIDLAGAAESVIATLICGVAPNVDAALAGLKEVAGDIERTIREHYATR